MLEPQQDRPFRITFWLRVALRCVLWGSLALFCGAAFVAHNCLRLSPGIYQGLHDSEGWLPLGTLSSEARGFVNVYYENPEYHLGRIKEYRHFEWPDPYNVFSAWLYRYTMEEEDILQLLLSNATKASPAKAPLQLEDMLKISYGEPRWKQSHLHYMLRRGSITPKRYREARDFLAKLES
jgi:hypothetical protein